MTDKNADLGRRNAEGNVLTCLLACSQAPGSSTGLALLTLLNKLSFLRLL